MLTFFYGLATDNGWARDAGGFCLLLFAVVYQFTD